MRVEMAVPMDDSRASSGYWREWFETALVAAARLDPGTGVFQMEFSEAILPGIAGLRANFCRYELRYAMRLTSRHAFRLYELVKSWQGKVDKRGRHAPFTMRLDDLRRALGVPEGKYVKYSHFRSRVLEGSVKQIRERTDISFSYKAVKESRAVVALKLTLVPKSAKPAPAPAGPAVCLPLPHPAPEPDFDALKRLLSAFPKTQVPPRRRRSLPERRSSPPAEKAAPPEADPA